MISGLTGMVGIMMISIGMVIQSGEPLTNLNSAIVQEFNINNMAASANMLVKDPENKSEEESENLLLTEVKMETAPASIYVPPRVEVYAGMTMEELAAQLNKSLKAEISGKGMVIAKKCIQLGVDPYVATAIILHETGCGQGTCSRIARECYNFGGQKGPGCGAYRRYYSVDEGLEGMIQNLYNNYYSQGLRTVETIGPRYAESTTWVSKINMYVGQIKSR